MAQDYFAEGPEQTRVIEGSFSIAMHISGLMDRLRDGDMYTLECLVHVVPSLREEITMYWLSSITHGTDLSTVIDGVNYLVDNDAFAFNPSGYALQIPGTKQHKLLLHLIKEDLLSSEDLEAVIATQGIYEEFANVLRSQFQQKNVRRNIPGAAAATTARRILQNRLNINRRGPINIIGQMMGAPATVRRARRATRRRKN